LHTLHGLHVDDASARRITPDGVQPSASPTNCEADWGALLAEPEGTNGGVTNVQH